MPLKLMYVPILKGKEGEFSALESLDSEVKSHLTPLIEIPPIPYDFAKKCPAKSLDEHLAGFPERLCNSCFGCPPYLDLYLLGQNKAWNTGHAAVQALFNDSADCGVPPTVVVSRTSSDSYLNIARAYSSNSKTGACIRLFVKDLNEEIDLDLELGQILEKLGQNSASSTDLVVDLEDLQNESSRAVIIARYALSIIPRKDDWRRIVLAAASFPEDLSDVDAATTVTLPRHEWDLWKALQRRPSVLPQRGITFGDYAISHPVTKELDPRTMSMSANIRYTAQDNWLIVKGRNVRKYGFSQYFELCRTLVELPEYCGSAFSWGDEYIEGCALGNTGPGNATTWRKVGVNHHLTLVTREIAKHHLVV
jgi:hypothetical protein